MKFKTNTPDTLPMVVVLAKQYRETGRARLGQLSASLQLGSTTCTVQGGGLKLKNNGYAHTGRR